MYGKVLVAVDGSPPSRLALLEAIKLVKDMAGTLRLVHVVDESAMDGALFPSTYLQDVIDSLRAVGQKALDDCVSLVSEHALQPSAMLLEACGRPVAEHVVAQAEIWPADLIVMGTHGRRGLQRLLMGSDAEMVVRTSPVPVLLVRGQQQSA